MSPHFLVLEREIEGVRSELLKHSVYHSLTTANDLRSFMEHHCFAVWDFMSLLKWLQFEFTCTSAPWIPKGKASVRAMINEIVLGEESDIHPNGGHTSHFELYMEAMEEAGASTAPIRSLIEQISLGSSVCVASKTCGAPHSAIRFVEETFRFIATGKPHVVASAFTFGREDLIPDMFTAFVNRMNASENGQFKTFQYYLQRHIEMDGDHHSHLAKQMIEDLCGDDSIKWKEATEAAVSALRARVALWDGVAQTVSSMAAYAE